MRMRTPVTCMFSLNLEGLGQVEHAPRGHVGPQQFLQEEVRQHVAALVPVVFLWTAFTNDPAPYKVHK